MAEFKTLTNAADSQARQLLRKHGNNVHAAIEEWFSKGMTPSGASSKAVSSKSIATMFAEFADPASKSIEADGLERLAAAIGLDLYAPELLMLGFLMQANDMTDITAEQFTRGMSVVGAGTTAELKAALPSVRARVMDDADAFSAFFKFAFVANKADGMRVLDAEVATALIRLLLVPRWPLGERFAAFLESSGVKNVTKDTWNQTLAFSKAFPTSVDSYEDDGAWPVMVDDFVEHMKKASA